MVARRTSQIGLLLGTLLLCYGAAMAETWYVDGAVSSSGKGTSWKTAFKTIQEGIDASSDRDTVTAADGTYVETIEFKGKNITLTSTDPLDRLVVGNTIVDGKQAGSVVTFSGTEDKGCVLSGFTIRDGKAHYGGGIAGYGALATIRNNTITGNSALAYGGGLFGCDGMIQNNIISGNSSDQNAGGLYSCLGTIQNNTISGNSAAHNGGGLYYCRGTIQDNVVTGNSAGEGGGLHRCHGTIQDNIVSGNLAARNGGGLYECGGTIQNNIVSDNSAEQNGGGLYECDGMIENNTISRNRADVRGGGLYGCDGWIQNNTISGNSATVGTITSYGGGLYWCGSTIEYNLVTGNWAGEGGGLYICDGRIRNNVIAGNWALEHGGGLSRCGGSTAEKKIENNTIADNRAGESGGGLYQCKWTILNCIIWGNLATDQGAQLYDSATPTYSCIQDWTGGGEGNIAPPLAGFVDGDGPDNDPETYGDNDYRLSTGSPCIDVGSNQDWMWRVVDLDGNPRLFHGGSSRTVDMGAYEYGFFPFRVTELLRGAGGQRELTWNSRPGDSYAIYSRADLSRGSWVQEATAPSQGETTSWTDVALFEEQRFYMIELK